MLLTFSSSGCGSDNTSPAVKGAGNAARDAKSVDQTNEALNGSEKRSAIAQMVLQHASNDFRNKDLMRTSSWLVGCNH